MASFGKEYVEENELKKAHKDSEREAKNVVASEKDESVRNALKKCDSELNKTLQESYKDFVTKNKSNKVMKVQFPNAVMFFGIKKPATYIVLGKSNT